MINALDRETFVSTLNRNLSPATPIQSQEYLFGRDAQLRTVEQALCSAGRTVFIFGERGVGKTSLAQTAAFASQSAHREPLLLACGPATTFSSLVRQIARELSQGVSVRIETTRKKKFGVGALGYEVEQHTPLEDDVPEHFDLAEAVSTIRRLGNLQKGPTVVVIDEFDRIAELGERTRFADFIKQVGDQRLEVRFLFCAVGSSLNELLGAHESCHRYVAGVEVPRLGWEARWQIIDGAASAFGVKIGDPPRFRIAAMSDGFPHYVHLVCEKLLWEVYNDPVVCAEASMEHYRGALAESVLGIEQHLRRMYDAATIRGQDEYESILWAVADHADIKRTSAGIYDSYVKIAKMRGVEPLSREEVTARLRKLKTESCGRVLAGTGQAGWFHFRETVMRGYVRLRAEEAGMDLVYDYAGTESDNTWRQRRVRKTFRYVPR